MPTLVHHTSMPNPKETETSEKPSANPVSSKDVVPTHLNVESILELGLKNPDEPCSAFFSYYQTKGNNKGCH